MQWCIIILYFYYIIIILLSSSHHHHLAGCSLAQIRVVLYRPAMLHAERLRHTTVASKTSDVTTMNFGTSLLVIFLLTSVGLVVYWFYHKYKLEREQIRFMQWARSVMRERYDSDTDSSHSGLHTPRYRTNSTWSNVSNDSNIDLNSQVDHSTTVSYGALDDDSTTASEWSGLGKADSLKRSFAQKQGRVGGYDGNEGFAQKQGYVYSHNNSKNFVVYDQAESKESHGGHAKHVKVRGHRIPVSTLATENVNQCEASQEQAFLHYDSRQYQHDIVHAGGMSL